MNKPTFGRLLVAALFLVTMIGPLAAAQTAPSPASNSAAAAQQAHPKQNAAQSNPACQRILAECKKLGYIQGQYKKDNGLWKDCFDPVVKGGTPTRDGKSVNVPVSPSDVQSCRAAVGSK
jgi:hypothetical protein